MTVPNPRRSTSPQTRGSVLEVGCGDPAGSAVLGWTLAVGPPRSVSAHCQCRSGRAGVTVTGRERRGIPDPRDPLA